MTNKVSISPLQTLSRSLLCRCQVKVLDTSRSQGFTVSLVSMENHFGCPVYHCKYNLGRFRFVLCAVNRLPSGTVARQESDRSRGYRQQWARSPIFPLNRRTHVGLHDQRECNILLADRIMIRAARIICDYHQC